MKHQTRHLKLIYLFIFILFFSDKISYIMFFIQLNVPFKIISLIETSQSIGGVKWEYPGKPPDTPLSRTCLVSHVNFLYEDIPPDESYISDIKHATPYSILNAFKILLTSVPA